MRPQIECTPNNPIFLAWTAAWLEAEGSITLLKRTDYNSFQVRIFIGQKDPAPLNAVLEGFPNGTLVWHKHRGIWILRYSSLRAIAFVTPLLPYLTFKRKYAEVVIKAQSIISHRHNRWNPRPQEEIDELWRLKNQIHKWTGVSLETRQLISETNRRAPMYTWAKLHKQCVLCGTIDIPHCARGLCRRCYQREYARLRRSQLNE